MTLSGQGERRAHVRRSTMPWRSEPLSECGQTITDAAPAITLDELANRVRDYGEARTAFGVCTHCWETAQRAPRWESDPVGVLARETRRADGLPSDPDVVFAAAQLRAELYAIAALIDEHRQEYEGCVAGLAQATDLTAHRHRREHRPRRVRQ